MSLDVSYSYCSKLTEKEKLKIDETVKANLKFSLDRKIIKIRFKKKKGFSYFKK